MTNSSTNGTARGTNYTKDFIITVNGVHIHSYSDTWSFDTTQHWHECTANDGAKTDVANHTDDPCTECGYDSTATSVTFSGLTADGGADATTTTLTLTFSEAITELAADDITLSGVAGVQAGTLSGSGPAYTLPISGFSKGGTLTVAVAKSGYNISGSTKTVTIYYYSGGDNIGTGDLTKWTAVSATASTFGTSYINAIAYGGGKFVAVGASSKIAYSTDGITWTAVSDGIYAFNGYDIAYGAGRFVAVGDDGKMAYYIYP